MDNEQELELNKEQAAIFAAFSDPTRLRIIKLLVSQQGEGALCVNALAGILGITQSAVSQHLRMLKNLDLVKGDRQGYRIHYKVNHEVLKCCQDMMSEALSVETTD
ncbi:MAG: winged helix-turn-helix transcriptional regulator [Dehalococcoidales bacterium]|nr:winged helix-turn-helix transcriptional regulator [Dehalococcoidales bacterium]